MPTGHGRGPFQPRAFYNPRSPWRAPAVPSNPFEDVLLRHAPDFCAPLSEPSGNVVDIIGGLVGTQNGTPTYGVAGAIPGTTAITFTASTEFFNFLDAAALNIGDGPATFVFLFRRTVDTGGQVSIANKGNAAYSLGLTSADKVFIGKVGTAILVSESGTTAADSNWHHVAITRSAAGAGNTLFYKDAVEGHTDVTAATALANAGAPLELGREGATAAGGTVAYFTIFKRVLTAVEIRDQVNAIPAALAGLWPKSDIEPLAATLLDDSAQSWSVTAPPFIPPPDDPQPAAPLAFDDTQQAWTVQVSAAAGFDPATGFPWPVADADGPAPLAFDDTSQSWTIAIPPPFVAVPDDPPAAAPVFTEDTAQSFAIQPPAAAAFDPASGFPWANEDAQQLLSGQDDTAQAWAVQPIAAVAAFDPATGFPWTAPQDIIEQPTWDDSVQSWPVAAAPFVGNDYVDDIIQPVWVDDTQQAWATAPPTAAFDPASGFPWRYDETHDRAVAPWTFTPESVGVWTTTLPLVTTVTGGYGPGGSAINFGSGGSATASTPGGSAANPTPGGVATNPKPGA